MVRKRRSEEPKAVALALLARKAYGFPANGGCASRGDSNKFIHIVKMPVLLKDFPKIFTANVICVIGYNTLTTHCIIIDKS